MKKGIVLNTLNYPKYAAIGFFQESQERVRKSHGKRAISVRATEFLLYELEMIPLRFLARKTFYAWLKVLAKNFFSYLQI